MVYFHHVRVMLIGAVALTCLPPVIAGTVFKANNSIALVQTNSWQAGGPPGATDLAAWDNAVVAGNGAVSLSGDLAWEGLLIGLPTQPGGHITLNLPGSLTLGQSGINVAGASRNLTIHAPVSLSSTQVWEVATAARILQVSGIVSGTGPLTKSGAGMLTLVSTNTYSVGTVINAGTITLSSDTALGDPANPVTFLGSGTLNMTASGAYGSGRTLFVETSSATGTLSTTGNALWEGLIDGAGSLGKAGTGLLTLSADNTYSGATVVAAGVLRAVYDTGWSPFSNLRLAGGVIEGTSGGTFTHALGTGAGEVQWQGSGGFSATNGDLTVNLGGGADTLTWGDTPGFLGNGQSLILSSGFADSTLNLANPIDLNGADRTIQVDNGSAVVDAALTAALSGATGGVVKTGTGSLQLADGNTFTGGLWVQAGAVSATELSDTSPGANLLRLGNATVSGEFIYTGDDDAVLTTRGVELVGTTGDGLITVNGSGTVSIASFVTSISASTQGRDLILGGSNTRTNVVSGPITQFSGTSNGGLIKNGDGLWALAGTNTYTGLTTVNGGVLRLSNPEILHDNGTLRVAGGTLDLGGHTESIATLSLASGTITNGSVTALVAITADSGTGSAFIQGPVTPMTKNSTGVVILTEPNSFGGQLTIINGRLVLNHLGDDINGSGTIRLGGSTTSTGELDYNGDADVVLTTRPIELGATTTGGGRLTVSGDGTLTIRGDLSVPNTGAKTVTLQGSNTGTNTMTGVLSNGSGTISLVKTGDGRWILTGANTYSGLSTITGGILQIGAGGTSGVLSSNAVITAPGVLAFNRSDTVMLPSFLSGTGTLRQEGGGNLVLTNANTYSGGTVINAGTLTLGHASALGPIASARADFGPASSGILRLNGFSPTLVGLNGDDTATVENGSDNAASLLNLVAGAGTQVFEGLLRDGGTQPLSLIKSGVGTLELEGTNTYRGFTAVNAGVLTIRDEAALGANPGAFSTNHFSMNGATATLRANESFAIDDSNRGIALGSAGGTFAVGEGLTLTLSNPITGAGGLTKADNGLLLLTADNSYAATTISGGTLQVGNGGATGTLGSGVTVNGGHLVINRSSDLVYATSISGTGTVSKLGSGMFTHSGAGSRTGITRIFDGTFRILAETGLGANPSTSAPDNLLIDGGILQAGASFSLDDANRGVTIGPNGGGIAVEPGFTLTMVRPMVGPGTATKLGEGTLLVTGDNVYSGSTVIAEGTLQIGSASALGSLSGNITNNGALVFNRNDAVVFPGLISGTGSVTKMGAAPLTFEGLNSFTGSLWIQNGMLSVVCFGDTFNGGGDLRLGSATLTGELEYTGAANVITARGIDLAGTTGGGRISVNGPNPIRIGGNVTASTPGAKTLTLQGSNAGANTVAGSVQNSGAGATSVTKTGDGRWVLQGNNSYSGTTLVNTGVLNIRHNQALGDVLGGTTVANGAALELQGGIDIGTEALSLAGTGSGNTGALRSINGVNSWAGTITLAAGGARIQVDAESLLLGAFAGNTQPLTLGGAGDVTLGGVVSTSTGGVTVDGPGTVTLESAERLSNTGPLTVNDGIFDLNSVIETVAAVTLNDGEIGSSGGGGSLIGTTILARKGTLGVHLGETAGGAVTTFTKSTDGTVSVTRDDHTYEGKTSVQEGVLEVRSVGALNQISGLGKPTTVANGTIDLGADTNSATLRVVGTSADSISDRVINLAGTTGPVTIEVDSTGILQLSSALTATGSGAKTLTLSGGNTGSNTVANTIPDSAGGATALRKAGAGTWVLRGNNGYSGGTTVADGRLQVENTAGSGTGSGPVEVQSGAIFGGTAVVAGTITVRNGARLEPGASVGTMTVGGLTLDAGAILEIEFSALPAHDQTLVTSSGGLTINGGGLYLYAEDSTTPWTTPGVYKLFQYSGSIGGTGVSALSVLNPQPGYTYDFRTNAGWVELRLTAGVPLVSVGNASVTEGNSGSSPLFFPITVEPTGSVAITVNYMTIDGTAKAANGDYTHTVGMLTIPAGTANTQIAVPINGELKFELDESFTLELSDVTNATLLASSATGTILNNDAADGRVYVKANATGNNNGFNWDDGFTDLQDALRTATAGQEIWVAKGTYLPTNSAVRTAHFALRPNVLLYGGFQGFETALVQRNWMNATSVLSGDIGAPGVTLDNAGPIVRTSLGAGGFMDGFTLRDGRNDGVQDSGFGGAMNILSGSGATVQNCIFENNYANQAGALQVHANSTFRRCIFRYNSDGSRGGAVQCYNSTDLFENCLFYSNTGGGRGGAMSLYHQTINLVNCTFADNTAPAGSAFYASNGGYVNALNCIFWDSGDHGGGIWVKSDSSNPDAGGYAAGVNLSYCNVRGGFNPPELGSSDNEMDADPLFVSQASQNYRLQSGSPCRDVGTDVGAPADDLDGGVRPFGPGYDMGAYEFGAAGPGGYPTGLQIIVW